MEEYDEKREKHLEKAENHFFDSAAQEWDTPERIARAVQVANEMVKTLKLDSDAKLESALEFGCGTGLVGFALKDYFQEMSLVDTSQGMIDVVDSKARNLHTGHVKGYCADLLKSNFEPQDLIFTSMAMHHVTALNPLLEKLSQMTQIGGRLCIVDLDQDQEGLFHSEEQGFDGHHGFDQQKLGEELRQFGFKVLGSHTFFRDIKLRKGQRVPYSLFIISAERI